MRDEKGRDASWRTATLEELRPRLGTVGLAVAPMPHLRYYVPRGKGMGAGQGALGGLKAGVEVMSLGSGAEETG